MLNAKIFSAGVEHDQLGELSKKTQKAYHLLCTPAKEEEDVEGQIAAQREAAHEKKEDAQVFAYLLRPFESAAAERFI